MIADWWLIIDCFALQLFLIVYRRMLWASLWLLLVLDLLEHIFRLRCIIVSVRTNELMTSWAHRNRPPGPVLSECFNVLYDRTYLFHSLEMRSRCVSTNGSYPTQLSISATAFALQSFWGNDGKPYAALSSLTHWFCKQVCPWTFHTTWEYVGILGHVFFLLSVLPQWMELADGSRCRWHCWKPFGPSRSRAPSRTGRRWTEVGRWKNANLRRMPRMLPLARSKVTLINSLINMIG